eukprot:6208124-Pleurochrysis_carterae.AAC.3
MQLSSYARVDEVVVGRYEQPQTATSEDGHGRILRTPRLQIWPLKRRPLARRGSTQRVVEGV